jgi:hypothetical protein
MFVLRETRQDKSRSYFKVVTCFAIQENQLREKKRKSSNTDNPLFIYNSSITFEPFLMLRCTIQISTHNLTHHQHNPLSVQPCHIVRRCNTSDHFLMTPNNPANISPDSPRPPTSPSFRNTIPSSIPSTSVYDEAVTVSPP